MAWNPANLDSISLLEQHAQEVLELEEREARRLLRIYREISGRLAYRIRNVKEESFSQQQAMVIMLQVQGAIKALQDKLGEQTNLVSKLMADRSIEMLVKETNTMNEYFQGAMQPIDLKAVLVTFDSENFLYNNYQASLETYSLDLRNRISNGIQQMVVERQTPQQMIERLQQDRPIERFFEAEEWRLRRIVRTEMHSINGKARLAGLKSIESDSAPGMMKTLYHPLDGRTGEDSRFVQALDLRVPLDTAFEYTFTPTRADGSPGKPQHRVFMTPPDRPNDRSILIPYHPSWD